jgi:hypothetical protein
MQLQLDFSGKKTEKITIAITDELRDVLNVLAKETGKERAAICAEYVTEKAVADFGILMCIKMKGKVSVNMAQL